MIEVLRSGPPALVQDLGRSGFAHLGVARSGAADRGSLRLANRLVGNPEGAAALEVVLGGLTFRVLRAITVALTGAECAGLDWGIAVSLPPGVRVELGTPTRGLRSYLAIRGGVDRDPVLGSRSTDTLSGLGPAPLRAGDLLTAGSAPSGPIDGVAAVPEAQRGDLAVIPGPRQDWFAGDALRRLTSAPWTVRSDSNRIGVRLDGPGLVRAVAAELVSEPTLPGALQVPPDGRPILLGPDAPVTGGYPVIAVVHSRDLDAIGQLRPGDGVRFRLTR